MNEEIWKTLNNFKKYETSKLSNGSQVKLSGLIFDESDPLYSETKRQIDDASVGSLVISDHTITQHLALAPSTQA